MFGEEICFKYTWRGYQERVLQEIETHLSDDKLHIIAPPGSGKTVLGLEVVRQLNKRTLILSPTITVRNQWIQRFVELFSDNKFKDHSYSLKVPAILTSSTYQGLHSAMTGKVVHLEESDDEQILPDDMDQGDKDLLKVLKENKIEVLVLDEAHHLKTEWWKSIMNLVSSLGDIRIISLTATPPYDSSALEWDRYMQLCGPVDAEISVPELVKEKNLCPHQDLIHFSEASMEEHEGIDQFYTRIDVLINGIVGDSGFEKLIKNHPVVCDPESHISDIFENVEYYSSLAIFLNSREKGSFKTLIKVLGLSQKKVPGLSGEWMEILLSNALYKDSSLKSEPLIKEIRKKLREHSAIENKRVVLRMKQDFNRLMSSSISKFRSIRDIADFEYKSLGEGLRMVILSDYVRKDSLKNNLGIDKFGVIPIFKYLIDSENGIDCRDEIAVLSGTVCIIPDNVRSTVYELASEYGVSEKDIKWSSLKLQKGFSEFILSSSKKSAGVAIITDLLTRGCIKIIVGTKSLLGEGWDCPAVNSLIMATFVGSYMLSNQIRGRAIRTDRSNTHKTSNIWHLMCLDTKHRYNNYDKDLLEQRFKCFTGLDTENGLICNGMERLNLRQFEFNKLNIRDLNNQMREQASKREDLYACWFDAINESSEGRIVKEIKTPKYNINRTYVFQNSLKYLFLQGVAAGFILVMELYSSVVKSIFRTSLLSVKDISSIVVLLSFVFILITMKSSINALILLIRHGSVSGSFSQISRAVVNTMAELDMIEDPDSLKINTDAASDGSVYCSLRNCSSYEQSRFLTAVREIVEHIENPRYIISRENRFPFRTLDYHAVPAIFAVKKEKALIFHKHWQKSMCKSKLYYTRNKEGRSILVKARTSSLSSRFVERTEITDSWKS